MTVSEKSIGGYGLLNENWLFGITNTESKKHRADCFREIGERTFSFFLDTAVEQGFEDREGQWTMSCEIVDAMQKKSILQLKQGWESVNHLPISFLCFFIIRNTIVLF